MDLYRFGDSAIRVDKLLAIHRVVDDPDHPDRRRVWFDVPGASPVDIDGPDARELGEIVAELRRLRDLAAADAVPRAFAADDAGPVVQPHRAQEGGG